MTRRSSDLGALQEPGVGTCDAGRCFGTYDINQKGFMATCTSARYARPLDNVGSSKVRESAEAE